MSNPLPKRPNVSLPKQPDALSSRRLFVTGVLFFLALLLLDLLLIFTDYSPPCLVNRGRENLTIIGFSFAQLSLLTHWLVFGRGWFLIRGGLLLAGTYLLAYLNSNPTLAASSPLSFASQLAFYGIYGTFLLILLYLIYYWFAAFQPKKKFRLSIKQILGWTTFVAFFLSLTKIANLSIVNDANILILALLSTPALLFPLFLFRKKRFLLHLFLLTLYGIVLCLILPLLLNNTQSNYLENFFLSTNTLAPIYLLLSSWYAARNYALKTNPHYLKSETALQATRQTASPSASATILFPTADPLATKTSGPRPAADESPADDSPVDYEA